MTHAAESQAGRSLLLVDDDEVLRERLAQALRARGLEVRTASDAEQALRLARERAPELAVVDLRMPGRSGLELTRELIALTPQIRVLILTGYASIATTVEAMKLGAVYYLPKPADADEVLASFARDAATPLADEARSFETPSLERLRWEHINRVLTDVGGNVSEAARRLNLHRRTLQRMLQKYPPKT